GGQTPANWPAPNTPGFVPYPTARDEVRAGVENALGRYRVLASLADPGSGPDDDGELYWGSYIALWGRTCGPRSAPRSERAGLQAEVLERRLIHDGHKVLRTHVISARRRTNRWGVTIGKEHRERARKMDRAVCMVGARMLRRMILNSPKRTKKKTAGRGRVVVLR